MWLVKIGSFQALWKSRMHVYNLVLIPGSWDTLDTAEWEMTKWDESPRLNLDISQASASYAVRPNPKFWHPKILLLILGDDFLDETTLRRNLIWHLRHHRGECKFLAGRCRPFMSGWYWFLYCPFWDRKWNKMFEYLFTCSIFTDAFATKSFLHPGSKVYMCRN